MICTGLTHLSLPILVKCSNLASQDLGCDPCNHAWAPSHWTWHSCCICGTSDGCKDQVHSRRAHLQLQRQTNQIPLFARPLLPRRENRTMNWLLIFDISSNFSERDSTPVGIEYFPTPQLEAISVPSPPSAVDTLTLFAISSPPSPLVPILSCLSPFSFLHPILLALLRPQSALACGSAQLPRCLTFKIPPSLWPTSPR